MAYSDPRSLPCLAMCKLIHCYQLIAPAAIRGACRFTPSCSEYALLVLRRDGLKQGLPRILRRLCRCRAPNGGIDLP